MSSPKVRSRHARWMIVRVVGHEQAAFARRTGSSIEFRLKQPTSPMRPDLAALVGRAVRLAGVLDDVQVVSSRDVEDLVHVRGQALDVDGDDRPRPSVIFASIWRASRSNVRGSMSTKTGIAALLEDRLPGPGERDTRS